MKKANTMPEGFISVSEAARRAGMTYHSMQVRLSPDHPDTVPHYKFENKGVQPSYRIPEDDFNKWLEAHKVTP